MLYYVYIISYTFLFLSFTHVPGRLAFPLLYPVKIVFWRYLSPFFSIISLYVHVHVCIYFPFFLPLSFPLGKCHLVIRVCQVYVCNRPFSMYLSVSRVTVCISLFHKHTRVHICVLRVCVYVYVYVYVYWPVCAHAHLIHYIAYHLCRVVTNYV